jgi:hypothetical protein
MKWNIKLETINLTGGLAARYFLSSRLCFNFFSHHLKIMKFYGSRAFGTFAFTTITQADSMAKTKEPNLLTLYKMPYI